MAAKTYLFHEISSYLPLLEGEEFDALVEDIKQFGQIEPAVLFDGKILDGRNRYRACKKLNIELQVREWKPSEATGMTPLQFVISENIIRRHLNTAQKAEIGMLLYPEIAKQVKEEQYKKQSETRKEMFKKGELIGKGIKSDSKETNLIDDPTTRTAYKVAQKVKVKRSTMAKAKKIKDTIYDKETGEVKDKSIAEEWEKAKRGESTVSAVYKEVQEKEFRKIYPKMSRDFNHLLYLNFSSVLNLIVFCIILLKRMPKFIESIREKRF